MIIDIMEYSEEQLAKMTHLQRMRVFEAQERKNRLYKQFLKQLRRERDNLIENGIFYSEIFNKIKQKMESEFNESVDAIRERLMHLIAKDAHAGDANGVPYTVDYTLSYEDRYIVVRDYYLNTYTDAIARYNIFLTDVFAATYVGDMYGILYDYMYVLAYG